MTNNEQQIRSTAFQAKAERMLDWSRKALEEMREHGRRNRLEEVERCFFTLLALIASIHEALSSSASVLRAPQWRRVLNELRSSDPLLWYMWKARDSDIHDALIKWRPGMRQVDLTIVDAQRAERIVQQFFSIGRESATEGELVQALFFHIYGVRNIDAILDRIQAGERPSSETLEQAGVDLSEILDSLVLQSFTVRAHGRQIHVAAPSSHLGKALPPSADMAASRVIAFYSDKLHELRNLSSASGT